MEEVRIVPLEKAAQPPGEAQVQVAGAGQVFDVEAEIAAEGLDEDASLSGTRMLSLAPEQDVEILVADDNAVNRDILVKLLQKSGFRALEAADGSEALAVIREASAFYDAATRPEGDAATEGLR